MKKYEYNGKIYCDEDLSCDIDNYGGRGITVCSAEIRRLRKFEKEITQKIKQGTLTELPCKVGDDAYFIVKLEKGWNMQIGYVQSISIDKDGIWIACKYSDGLSYWHKWKDGYLFFSAVKADKRLKELQNGKEKAN